jgi:molybdopterin molybdotransferase
LLQAFADLSARFEPVRDGQAIDAIHGLGRVLAEDLVSPIDLPGNDVAAMDGYAVIASTLHEGPNRLQVAGRVLAGHATTKAVVQGQCIRIMTGAPMPQGSDSVVMLEYAATQDNGDVVVQGPVKAGTNRRARGEHVRAGDRVLRKGRRLRAPELAMAQAMGFAQVPVVRTLRVGVLSTGDELRDPPSPLPAGGMYDSNRPMLMGALARKAFASFDMGICGDDPEVLAEAVDSSIAQQMDVLLISGGASLGDADIVRALGGVEFLPVSVRPGRGLVHASLRRDGHRLAVLGLPGNAVAAFVMLQMLVLPFLRRLSGEDAAPPAGVPARLLADASTREGRIDMRRARLGRTADGLLTADLLADQGSAMLRTICDADALVAIGPGARTPAGTWVAAFPLDALTAS